MFFAKARLNCINRLCYLLNGIKWWLN